MTTDRDDNVFEFPKTAAERQALAKAKRDRERQRLINQFVDETGQGLFHTPGGIAYADLIIEGCRQTWPIKSKQFRFAYCKYIRSQVAKPVHHAAMPYREVPTFVAALRQRSGVAARALEPLILCASRSGEVRGKAPTPTLTAIDKPVSATPDPTPPDTEKEASMAKPHIVAESDKLPDSFAPITESKPEVEIADAPMSIAKPAAFDLDKFKSKRAAAIANVETLLGALPHHNMAAAKDFVRTHPDEEKYWSDELCFVNVPIKGQKRDTLHLIAEDLAVQYVPSGRILRFRLALATKPYDVFFLCQVPTRNLDNSYNKTNQLGCEVAKTLWVQLTSRKDEGVETYKIDHARDQDAFPPPKWPTQSLNELINVTFTGRMIETEDHPALLRLIGAKQKIT
jgi:hypothetical protein